MNSIHIINTFQCNPTIQRENKRISGKNIQYGDFDGNYDSRLYGEVHDECASIRYSAVNEKADKRRLPIGVATRQCVLVCVLTMAAKWYFPVE